VKAGVHHAHRVRLFTSFAYRLAEIPVADDLVAFGLLTRGRVPARPVKAGDVIFEEGDPATPRNLREARG
jgi:hypothetical protein